jgi:hypothetical protein
VSFEASTKPKMLANLRSSVDMRSKREIGAGWESPISKRQTSKIDNAPTELLRMIFLNFGGVCRGTIAFHPVLLTEV